MYTNSNEKLLFVTTFIFMRSLLNSPPRTSFPFQENLHCPLSSLHSSLKKIENVLSRPIQSKPLERIDLERIPDVKSVNMEIWLQDESVNPTGTHKDYLGQAILRIYKEIIFHKLHSKNKNENQVGPLPHFSIYSSGNAAFAIGIALKQCDLPALKTMIAPGVSQEIEEKLRRAGCEVYRAPNTDWITSQALLDLTHNKLGFEFEAYRKEHSLKCYGNLIQHVMRLENGDYPDAVMMPYGSGQLFEETLDFLEEAKINKPLRIIGITSDAKNDYADKLYGNSTGHIAKNVERIYRLIQQSVLTDDSCILTISKEDTGNGLKMHERLGLQAEPSAAVGMGCLLSDSLFGSLFQFQHECHLSRKCMVIISTGKGKINAMPMSRL